MLSGKTPGAMQFLAQEAARRGKLQCHHKNITLPKRRH